MGAFLVIGIGRFGVSVAKELTRMKQEVMALDESEAQVAEIVGLVTDVIIGDAKDEGVLNSIGVQNFDGVIVSMAGRIEDSILTTMMLKEMGAKPIICKAQNERHAKILSQLGADRVIRPEFDIGKRVARSLVQRNTIDFLEISPEYGIMEVMVPEHWVGKSILKNNPRGRYKSITIIAIRCCGTDELNFSPKADTILREGDILTVIGSKEDLDKISVLR